MVVLILFLMLKEFNNPFIFLKGEIGENLGIHLFLQATNIQSVLCAGRHVPAEEVRELQSYDRDWRSGTSPWFCGQRN